MRVNSTIFKEKCKTILNAIDNKETSLFTETLELIAKGNSLSLNVTNREYYVTAKFDLGYEEDFHAAVNAAKFLKLISKITADDIDLSIDGNGVKIVAANGKYHIPMTANNNDMITLPTIDIENVTTTMEMDSSSLISIAVNNSKELQRGVPSTAAQNYYYVDEKGAITYTTGACVNNFDLEKPIKMMLSDKVVKLFRLFKPNCKVQFSMGQDPNGDVIQTKVRFEHAGTSITAKLPDMGLVSNVPCEAIRNMSVKEFAYSYNLNRVDFMEAINRILLFNDDMKYGYIEYANNAITVRDFNKKCSESVGVVDSNDTKDPYTFCVNLTGFVHILEGITDEYVNVNFGDKRAIVVRKQSVIDMMTEIKPQQ